MTEQATKEEASNDLFDPSLIINREVSWLQFNDRVLAMAATRPVPLLERLRFLAIFTSNLDEYFMVRVAAVREQVEAGMDSRGSDGMTPAETLDAIVKHLSESMDAQVRLLHGRAAPGPGQGGHPPGRDGRPGGRGPAPARRVLHPPRLPGADPAGRRPQSPVPVHLQPVAVAGRVRARPGPEAELFARVKVPAILPRFVPVDRPSGPSSSRSRS